MINIALWFLGLTLYFFGAIVIFVSARKDTDSSEIWPYFFALFYPLAAPALIIGLCVEDLMRND